MTDYELAFWGDCLGTANEERKHRVYAALMGIDFLSPQGRVLDIGAGPVSMLLKCVSRGNCVALDPLMASFPAWVRQRYVAADIEPVTGIGEEAAALFTPVFDEVWVYNVLQHVTDPERVVASARKLAPRVRLFEWVGIPAYDGHPHELNARDLGSWLGEKGRVVPLACEGCHGEAFIVGPS